MYAPHVELDLVAVRGAAWPVVGEPAEAVARNDTAQQQRRAVVLFGRRRSQRRTHIVEAAKAQCTHPRCLASGAGHVRHATPHPAEQKVHWMSV